MDLIKTELIKAKEIIDKIEVKKGTILVDPETLNEIYSSFPDIFGKPQVEYYLTPEEEEAGLTRIVAIEFYGGDGKQLDITDLSLKIRQEIQENRSLPFDPQLKIEAIKEIIKFYSDVENRIVKNDNGKYQCDDIHLIDLTLEDLNSFEKTIYFDTLEIIKNKLKKEIHHLEKTVFVLEKEIPDKLQVKNQSTKEDNPIENKVRAVRQYPTKSFQLNPLLFRSDSIISEKLKEFHEALINSGLINPIDFRYFMQSFKNHNVTRKIRWIGTPNELYYLIKTLYEKNLIVQFKNYWDVTCKCFTAYHKKTILCTPKYLERCKEPTRNEQLRNLNSVIAVLQ
jgi:hypothetical protein